MMNSIPPTKLNMPPLRASRVLRPRLKARLDDALSGAVTLVCAPAGFGKTTLVAEWAAGCGRPVAWLSLDEADNDPVRFLSGLVAALQSIAADANAGAGALALLQSPQLPPMTALMAAILRDAAALPSFVLVLDDGHLLEAAPVQSALRLLLEQLPPSAHLLIATRHDPPFPLSRLRARGQLAELRSGDLRFTAAEAAQFLNHVMSLNLTEYEVSILEARTEGWAAGLQLAALSLRQHPDTASFLQAFAGSNRYVFDYLMEEVWQRQPESVQRFLLHTSLLERLCGPLCAAVAGLEEADGQALLQSLEEANLFLVPLDQERHWYRYHHLFAESLRRRLRPDEAARLHGSASCWFETNGYWLEAFRHAAAAGDLERAGRLLDGDGMPLLFRGAAAPIVAWLDSLPAAELAARPPLAVTYASALLFTGRMSDVEPQLRAAERSLAQAPEDAVVRDQLGHIASIRAALAVVRQDTGTILAESKRALAHLHPDNLPVRTSTIWTLGYASELQGDRVAAAQAYTEAIAISRSIGHRIIQIMASLGLGGIQHAGNQLELAAKTYTDVLGLAGDPPHPVACDAYLGLGRIAYERNELAAAEFYGERGRELAQQLENTDVLAAGELLLARLKLAQADMPGALAAADKAYGLALQHRYLRLLPDIAAEKVRLLLRQGDTAAAAALAEQHQLPLARAAVHLACGEAAAALALLAPVRSEADGKGWADLQLHVRIAQALALHAAGRRTPAVQCIGEALALAEPGRLLRAFADEGPPMARLLAEPAVRALQPAYTAELLALCAAAEPGRDGRSNRPAADRLAEPLSERELEVLRLIALGLSNQQIAQRLFLALSSVKGHNQNIFSKLQVDRRTEAVARARELGLLDG